MENQVLAGLVQSGTGGFVPLGGAAVTLYRATEHTPIAVGHATTDAEGRFSIPVAEPESDAVFYARAHVREGVVLVAVIGSRIRESVVINELTTVAAAYSMAQFTDGESIGGSAPALRIAAGMNDNLVSARAGAPSEVLLAPPNADQTCTLRAFRSLGNLIAAWVRREPAFDLPAFLEMTTPPGGSPPADTFRALLAIARNPAHYAGALWTQSVVVSDVYRPRLGNPVDAWTLAVKVNATGNDDYLFGGPANIAFDRNGYAWIANNVFQGTPDSGNFIVVLRPDGTPARGENGEPTSPVFGGGLFGPGWGITIDPRGHAWVGNFFWGSSDDWPKHGSVSEFRPTGHAVSGEHGHLEGCVYRVQATVSDDDGNIWMACFGNDSLAVYVGGDPEDHRCAPAGTGTFGVAIGPDGTVWVSSGGGGLGWPTASPGSVSRFRLEAGELVPLEPASVTVGSANKAIAVDSRGHAWLSSSADGKVYHLGPDGRVAGPGYAGGGIDTPWGICVDGDDNVWVANFGVMGPGNDYTHAGLSKLKGAHAHAEPRGVPTGQPLTPPTGYTLPTGGDPVLLRTGEPLYKDGTACFSPFMRATSCQIDAAGNVWVVNNWKPRFGTDFEPGHGNPGGDGIVIFVGLAKPPAAR